MNIKRIKEIVFHKLGIDGAILYTTSARIIQAGGGIVTVFLIAKFLSKEEQGFYFTFASVLAIQIFFELGLGGILTQFVAHEMAHIRIKNLRCRSIFIYLQPKYYSSWLHTIH